MKFSFRCPKCRLEIEAWSTDVGKKMACSVCGQKVQVPKPPDHVQENKTVLGVVEETFPVAKIVEEVAISIPVPPPVPAPIAVSVVPCNECGFPNQISMEEASPHAVCRSCGEKLFKPRRRKRERDRDDDRPIHVNVNVANNNDVRAESRSRAKARAEARAEVKQKVTVQSFGGCAGCLLLLLVSFLMWVVCAGITSTPKQAPPQNQGK